MFFRIVLVLLILPLLYVSYTIVHFKWIFHDIETTKVGFLEQGNTDSNIVMVEFLSYGCGYCRDINPTIKELIEKRPDVKYITRPVLFGEEDLHRTTRIIMAAGLQDKFWELHNAVMEYPTEDIPDSFIEETAALYDINFEQLIKDAESDVIVKAAEHNTRAVENAGINSVPSFVVGKNIYQVTADKLPELQDLLNLLPSSE